jgi:hypothetical protein
VAGMALANPIGELLRLAAALSRSQTVVTFSWFKAGVGRTWARSR